MLQLWMPESISGSPLISTYPMMPSLVFLSFHFLISVASSLEKFSNCVKQSIEIDILEPREAQRVTMKIYWARRHLVDSLYGKQIYYLIFQYCYEALQSTSHVNAMPMGVCGLNDSGFRMKEILPMSNQHRRAGFGATLST